MTFRVGQKVVCIRYLDWAGWPGANYPEVGPTYTVRSINDEPKGAIICLEEIDNAHLIPAHGPIEPGFIASAFRPIVENKKRVSFTMGADPADPMHFDLSEHRTFPSHPI
jgi:hypothetical protein